MTADFYPYGVALAERDPDTPSGYRWVEVWNGEANGHEDALALARRESGPTTAMELSADRARILTVCKGPDFMTIREWTVKNETEGVA